MKTILILFFCVSYTLSKAQENLKLFSEPKNGGFILYASNNEYCPVSIDLDLKLDNLIADKQQKLFVIPEQANKFKLLELNVIEPSKDFRYSSYYYSNYGDINLQDYDSTYIYDLPYGKGERFLVYQGYNGSFSHQNEYALDFVMPEGTEIAAVREGIVVKVVQQNTTSCPSEECNQYNNFILIYHSDGTLATYAHIRLNGSKVKEGDRVNKGDIIAFSGNTGWTNGPHLHFACFLPGIKKGRTIKTPFRVNSGNEVTYLKEKETYIKNY